MAASSNIATAINHYRTQTPSGIAIIRNLPEAATQSFLQGTPVQLSGGYIQACATINSAATALIAGFSNVPGASLTTSGVPKTQNLTYSVPNQSSAVVTPLGAPPNDGTTNFNLASPIQTFVGTLGDSNSNASAVLAESQVGAIYGLTKDAGNNFWYVDLNITTTAGGACLVIVSLVSPVGTLNGLVEFRVANAAIQI